MNNLIEILNNNFFLEPLEQFEVTKVGYEFWYENGFLFGLVEFFKNIFINNNTVDILSDSSLLSVISKHENSSNFFLPLFNFENINVSYDFFDSYV